MRKHLWKAFVVAGIVLAVGSAAGASPNKTVTLVRTGGEIPFATGTYLSVRGALNTDDTPSISLGIEGLESIAGVPMTYELFEPSDDPIRVITLKSSLGNYFDELSPFSTETVELLVTGIWSSETDPSPDVMLAVRAHDITLDQIYAPWSEVAGDIVTFGDVVLAFTNHDFTLNPSQLPPVVGAFLGTAEQVVLDNVAELIGELDIDDMPALVQAARLVGREAAELAEVIDIRGALAESAAMLFNGGAPNGDGFSLDGAIEVDSTDVPDWLTRATGFDPTFRFRLGPAPARTPSIEYHDTFAVTTGGTTNDVTIDVSLEQAKTLTVGGAIDGTFNVPFGLEWMELQNAAFTLKLDTVPNPDALTATFDVDIPITTPAPHAHIEVRSSGGDTTGVVDVDGDIPVDDLVEWTGGSTAFTNSNFDGASIGEIVVHDVELSFAAGSTRRLGIFADADVPTPDTITDPEELQVEVFLGFTDDDATAATMLAAARVEDETCTSFPQCIHLGSLVPIPNGGIAADITMPAINLAVIQPQGASFDPTGFGDDTQRFLEKVFGDPVPDPITIEGDLNLFADIPLHTFDDTWNALGIEFTDPDAALRITGSLGFELKSILGGGVEASLKDAALEITAPHMRSIHIPEDLPAWFKETLTFTADQWSMFLRYEANGDSATDDTVAFGSRLEGVNSNILPDVDFAFEALFAGTPGTETWDLTLSALMGQWEQPFDIDWLTIEGARAVATFGSAHQPTFELCGKFKVGGHPLEICLDVRSLTEPDVSLTVELGGSITVQDMLTPLNQVLEPDPDLPPSIAGAGFSDGTLVIGVKGANINVDAKVTSTFPLNGRTLDVDLLFSSAFPGGVEGPRFTVGVRPGQGLMLSHVLPEGVTLPVFDGAPLDIPLIPDPDLAAFGFVFSNQEFGIGTTAPDTVKAWFGPLFGGNAVGRSVSNGLSALGSLSLPSPLDKVALGVGLQPDVLLNGTIPLPGSDGFEVKFGMELGANPEKLPTFVRGAKMFISAYANLDDAPSLGLTLGGEVTVRMLQGIDPAIAGLFENVGLHVPDGAAPASGPCPRLGERLVVDGRAACFDLLKVGISGSVVFGAGPPPSVSVGLTGTIESVYDDSGVLKSSPEGWKPFGIPYVSVNQLIAKVAVVTPGPAHPVKLVFGGAGVVEIFGKPVNGAVQMGLGIVPSAPVPTVSPTIEDFGIRGAFLEGIGKEDLLSIQALAAETVGAPVFDDDIIDKIDAAIPNIALRNLAFSFSPAGVKDLCIPLGISLRGDLYVNPTNTEAANPEAGKEEAENCHPETFDPQPVPPDGELCEANIPNGCVAGALFSLTPQGIVANGVLAGQDLDPLPIRFENAIIDFRLTFQQQLLKISGGAEIGPDNDPWAEGKLAIRLEPTDAQFVAKMKIFGFSALMDARYAMNDLLAVFRGAGEAPEMDAHVVLASSGTTFGQDTGPSFKVKVTEVTRPILQKMDELVDLLDDVIDDFNKPYNKLNTIFSLPERLDEANLGIDVPGWIAKISERLGELTEMTEGEETITLNKILNGFDFDGVRMAKVPSEKTCTLFGIDGLAFELGTVTKGADGDLGTSDDKCWRVVDLNEGVWVYPHCYGFTVDDKCYAIPPIPDIAGICAKIFPSPSPADEGTPGANDGKECTTEEVAGVITQLFTSRLQNIMELPDLDEALAKIRAFGGGTSSLFKMRCAEASVRLNALGDSEVGLGFDATVLGDRRGIDLDWNFNDPDGSGKRLLEEFWDIISGQAEGDCGGASDALFGPNGISVDQEPPIQDDASFEQDSPPPPPPPVLGMSLDAEAIDENGVVTLTAGFDRDLLAVDGARTLTIDWGDGTAVQNRTIAIGARSVDVTHRYLDDGESGTRSDTYDIVVRDTTTGLGVAGEVLVRNLAPVMNVVLDDATIDENDVAGLTVNFTDVGTLDTHQLFVDWGDGSPLVSLPSVTSGHRLTHRYLDDPDGDVETYGLRVRVKDDDTHTATRFPTITVNNVSPAGITLAPTSVTEGAHRTYLLGFTDPGTLDAHTASVDWNEDGTFDETVPVLAGARTVELQHLFDDDNPTGTPADDVDVVVRVNDDDGGQGQATRTVEVRNVAPTICLTAEPGGLQLGETCPETTTVHVNEGGSVGIEFSIADPGLLDTHRVVIDWGHGSIDDTVIEPPVGQRNFTASALYGDNGSFTIGVSVTDDDTGYVDDSAPIVADNVNPVLVIDETGAVLADGPDGDAVLDTPTFIVRKGVNLPMSARATDPGSDDLTFRWDWDATNRFDTTTSTFLSRVNPPSNDPFPSPTVQPRDVTDSRSHKWSQPCLYNVGVSATDDDGGAAADDTWVVVTGTDTRVRAPGWWYNQYDTARSNKNVVGATTLGCYLEVVRHMSRVFNSFRVVDTYEQARDVLNTKQTSDANEIMIRQLMATWLNVGHGSLRLDQMVDTNLDGVTDQRLSEVLLEAESVRLDPASTRAQLLAQEDKLQSVNGR